MIKQYQNETATRQIQDSFTISNLKARKINTPLSLPIHQDRCQYSAASVVVFDSLYAFSILCQIIRCCCFIFVLVFLLRRLRHRFRFLGPVVYPPPPPPLSQIPRTRRISLVLCRRLCCCRCLLWSVLLCLCRRRRCQ